MCLASIQPHPPVAPVSFGPAAVSPAAPPVPVTDGLVELANDLLNDAPAAVRAHVLGLIGVNDTPNATIPTVSVAYWMGVAEQHAEAVRTLTGLSTLFVVRK